MEIPAPNDAMKMVVATDRPGYNWVWDGMHGQWSLRWEPVPNVYSPPCLHAGIHFGFIDISPPTVGLIGLIIGKQGSHLKRISAISGSPYIYFLHQTRRFEIWGSPAQIQNAIFHLSRHLDRMLSRHRPHPNSTTDLPIPI